MKKNIIAVLAIIAVMAILPALAIMFAPSVVGMMTMVMILFLINTVFSASVGIFAGADIKNRWYLVAVNAGVFMLALSFLIKMEEGSFLIYAIGYLLIGTIAMAITAFIRKIIK